MSRLHVGAFALALAAAVGGPAAALTGLVGDAINVTLDSDTNGSVDYTDNGLLVDASIEIDGANGLTNIGAFLDPGEFLDFNDNTLSFSFGPEFGGSFEFIISGIDADLIGVSQTSFTPPANGGTLSFASGQSDYRISDSSFGFQLIFSQGTDANDVTTGSFGLSFADDNPGPSEVPLPASALLLLAGVGGLGVARRRRRKQ